MQPPLPLIALTHTRVGIGKASAKRLAKCLDGYLNTGMAADFSIVCNSRYFERDAANFLHGFFLLRGAANTSSDIIELPVSSGKFRVRLVGLQSLDHGRPPSYEEAALSVVNEHSNEEAYAPASHDEEDYDDTDTVGCSGTVMDDNLSQEFL